MKTKSEIRIMLELFKDMPLIAYGAGSTACCAEYIGVIAALQWVVEEETSPSIDSMMSVITPTLEGYMKRINVLGE